MLQQYICGPQKWDEPMTMQCRYQYYEHKNTGYTVTIGLLKCLRHQPP